MRNHRRSGFTLIELLLFSAIFALIIGAFITILISMVSVQSSQSASVEAKQQGQFLIQQLQYYISSARLVDMTQDTATTTLVLREPAGSSLDPTIFTLATGTVYLQQGVSSTPQALTSKKVTISNLSFTRHYNLNSSSSALGTDSVSYSFTVSVNTGLQSQFSQQFQSSAAVLAPVPKVALVQQAKAENNSGTGVSSLVKQFLTANESGDMLLAVVAYRGTGTSSIVDTNGNTWTMVASTTTMAPSGTIALYAALNVASGANTATVSFASGATYASVFLYEYRGAAASSAFDAWGAQAQAGMLTPSSPSVSPTSTVELLFGIDDNSTPITATFSPGTGYSLETSSTAGNNTQVFVEDMNQYITNPVTAAWTSGVLTSSTAMIATFISASSVGGGSTDLSPVVRGTGIQASSASSYTVSWPAGTQAGDLAVIFYAGGWNVSGVPTGWTENETTGNSANWGGTVLSKVLTSTDISTGSVVINTYGTYDGVAAIVTFVGGTAGIRETDYLQSGSGASTVNVSSTSNPLGSDTAIYFGSNRAASTDTMNRGTLQRQANDGSAASGALYTENLSTSGQFGVTGSYSVPGSGYYQAIVVVKGQ